MASCRPLWPLLITALFCVPVFYVLSCGPLVWLVSRGHLPKPDDSTVLRLYATPINPSWNHGTEWWQNALDAYLDSWR